MLTRLKIPLHDESRQVPRQGKEYLCDGCNDLCKETSPLKDHDKNLHGKLHHQRSQEFGLHYKTWCSKLRARQARMSDTENQISVSEVLAVIWCRCYWWYSAIQEQDWAGKERRVFCGWMSHTLPNWVDHMASSWERKYLQRPWKPDIAGIQKTLSLRAGWPQTLKLEMLTGDWPQLQTTLPHICILMQKVHKQGITGPMGKSKLSVAFPVNLIFRRIPSQDGGNVPLFQPAGCAHQHT